MSGISFIKTHHSFHEGSGQVKNYVSAAKEAGLSALAIIDRSSLAELVSFYDRCIKSNIAPVMGATISLYDEEIFSRKQVSKNKTFYDNLKKLLSNLSLTNVDLPQNILDFEKDFIIKLSEMSKANTKAKKDALPRNTRSLLNSLPKYTGVELKDKAPAVKSMDELSNIFSTDDFNFIEEINNLIALSVDYKYSTEACFGDLVILAKNEKGLDNLKRIISKSYISGQEGNLITISKKKRASNSHPKVLSSYLKSRSDGLVCILGASNDELVQAVDLGEEDSLESVISFYKEIFPSDSVFLGVDRAVTPDDGRFFNEIFLQRNKKIIELSISLGIPAFALNKALFCEKGDYEAHDIKSAILLDEQMSDVTRVKNYYRGNYLKGLSELCDDFSDLRNLVDNNKSLAKLFYKDDAGERTPNYSITLDESVLPDYPIPEGYTPSTYMAKLASDGLDVKLEIHLEMLREQGCEREIEVFLSKKNEYTERLNVELDIIGNMGFCGYFLIVADFIRWGKDNGVPVGTGRGSGAGSLVAYGLDITDVDPITHGLIFERFLNPERVSMPDFDVDFGSGFHPETGEVRDRDSVISYVQHKYDDPKAEFPSVAQIATHGLMLPRSGFKALVKAKGGSVKFGDDITKLFPEGPEISMSDCYEDEIVQSRLEVDPVFNEYMKLTGSLVGLKRNSGVHAGGVAIAPAEITDLTAIMSDISGDGKIIAQLDKDDIERAGLVKFDFLGLATLTNIALAVKLIKDNRGIDIDLRKVSKKDEKTINLLKDANTHGVFQVESRGMRDLLRKVLVDDIEDLSALLALFRPGPLQSGMVDNFIARKHGREEISYPDENYQHDLLKPVLEPTYGVILYQEQVMKIAQVLSGYTLGEADMLRRAMGKKDPVEMAEQRSIFEDGAKKQGVDPDLAVKIFDLVEKFAGYGFNKSHSMAYAYISFQTAWLKAHYPSEYMAALLTAQMDNMEDLKETLIDCSKNGIEVLPPDINESAVGFMPDKEGRIRFGLGAIHGVGDVNLKKIIDEREKGGAFKSTADIVVRCGSAFSLAVSSAMVKSGTLDSLDTLVKIPEGKVRKRSDIPYFFKTNKTKEELKLEDLDNKLKRVVKEGKVLREIIDSLTTRYSDKYGLQRLDTDNLAKKIDYLFSFYHSQEVDERSNGEFYDVLVADKKALVSELDKREELAKEYRGLKREISEVGEIKPLDFGDELALFDKRAYLNHECAIFSALKAKDRNTKKISEVIEALDFSEIEIIPDKERLAAEMVHLSYYVTGHPYDVNNLRGVVKKRGDYRDISSLSSAPETSSFRVGGVLQSIRKVKVKKEGRMFGREMAIISIDDGTGAISTTLFPDTYDMVKDNLYLGESICLHGKSEVDDFLGDGSLKFIIDKIEDPLTGDIIFEEKRKKFNK